MIKKILCPKCGKLLCKLDEKGIINKIYLYCKICKEEKYIERA